MKAGIVAFAFGAPSTLRSNRAIAAEASEFSKEIGAPVYTQVDVLPLDPEVDATLTEECYPDRVPTLRIARGAVRWALQRGVKRLWICAADPHVVRCLRDLRYAADEAHAGIEIKSHKSARARPRDFWFCPESAQTDTRLRWVWGIRDRILLHTPMWLYARIAS